MTIQSASAALTSSASITSVTGFKFYQQGQLDLSSGTIKCLGTSSWASLSTWESWHDWITTKEKIKWTAPVIDIGSVD